MDRSDRARLVGESGDSAAEVGTPGKRSRVDGRYAVQTRRSPAPRGPLDPAEPRGHPATSSLAGHDDPFALHLEAERPVQRREAGPGATAGPVHEAAGRGVAGAGGPLPFLDELQRSFGPHDLSGVTAHVGGPAAAACEDMGAQAYATGSSTAFATPPDLHTAAHEAAHTVQQRGGVQLRGGVGQADDEHERHADAVADRVVAGQSAAALLDAYAPRATSAAEPVQLKWGWRKGKGKDKDKDKDKQEDQAADEPDEAALRKAKIDAHARKQAKVYAIIDNPKFELDPSKGISDPGKLLKNTCEWLKRELTKLYVLDDTHDATTRSGDGRIAHFNRDVAYPKIGGEYAENPEDMSGIGFHDKGDRGSAEKGRIELYNVKLEGPDADVTKLLVDSAKQTLVHEVQHQADGHADPSDPAASPDPDSVKMVASEQLELYKSEFRAFWMQPVVDGADYGSASQAVRKNESFIYSGPNFALSPKEQKETKAGGITRTVAAAEVRFVNQRQEDIFRELAEQKAYKQFGYFYATDKVFRAGVHEFTKPASANLVNSVRINDLIDALDRCKSTMKEGDAAVTDALAAAEKLDGTDREFLADKELSSPLWDKAEQRLPKRARDKLRTLVAPSAKSR